MDFLPLWMVKLASTLFWAVGTFVVIVGGGGAAVMWAFDKLLQLRSIRKEFTSFMLLRDRCTCGVLKRTEKEREEIQRF